jgi:hypothetical protein
MSEHAGYVLETLSHVHETPHADLWSTLREQSAIHPRKMCEHR